MADRLKNGLKQDNKDVELVSKDYEFYQFYIKGSKGEIYETIYDEGNIYCDCPDYDFRSEKEMGTFLCKHCIKALEIIIKTETHDTLLGDLKK